MGDILNFFSKFIGKPRQEGKSYQKINDSDYQKPEPARKVLISQNLEEPSPQPTSEIESEVAAIRTEVDDITRELSLIQEQEKRK